MNPHYEQGLDMIKNKKNSIDKSTAVESPSDISMTPWYDPMQLLDTALQVLVSGLFIHHADRRAFYTEWDQDKVKPLPIIQAGSNEAGSHAVIPAFDNKEFWFDFVADTGDGGNSTYAVATQLLADEIRMGIDDRISADPVFTAAVDQLKTGDLLSLPRGDALVLGGDLVYPTAGELEYKKKFINIFKAALPRKTQREIQAPGFEPLNRHIFAFPQNHDWYDSLASFSQIFCGVENKFLDMHCQQRQSYAAVKLPNDWWLFGLDLALSGDIDELQFEYFRKIIEGGAEEDGTSVPNLTWKSKVILIYPEPIWTKAAFGEAQSRGTYRFEQLEVEIEKKTGKDIAIRLSGDQHYYRRYSTIDSQNHLVTCGSGGAFLHPTHGPDKINELQHVRRLTTLDMPRRFRFHEDIRDEVIAGNETVSFHTDDNRNFPGRDASYRLSKGNLFAFFYNNKHFGILTGISYFLIVWIVFTALHSNIKTANIISLFGGKGTLIKDIEFTHILQAAEAWTWAVYLSPGSLIIMAGILLAFTEFTRSFNSHAPSQSRFAGLLHGIVHLTMVFVCYWGILLLGKLIFGSAADPINAEVKIFPFLLCGLAVFVLGYLVGSFIMGAYLFVTVNLHRRIKKFPFLHSNEAYSSLKIAGYKGFLRFRITQDKLEAFFIGIEEIPTLWETTNEKDLDKPTWIEPGKPVLKPMLYDYWMVKIDPMD